MPENSNVVISLPALYALGALAIASVGLYIVTKMMYNSAKTFVESLKPAKAEK